MLYRKYILFKINDIKDENNNKKVESNYVSPEKKEQRLDAEDSEYGRVTLFRVMYLGGREDVVADEKLALVAV